MEELEEAVGAEVLEQVKEERLHCESRERVEEEKRKTRVSEAYSNQTVDDTACLFLRNNSGSSKNKDRQQADY